MLVFLHRTRSIDSLLYAKTGSTALREGDQILVEIFSTGFCFNPSLRSIHMGIRENVGVAIE